MRREREKVEKVLVSCGATDPQNITETVLEALADLPRGISIIAVSSSRAPHLNALARRFGSNVTFEVDVTNMADLITGADIAIGSPGVSAYERAVLGLPSILIPWAENQCGIARMLLKAGAALDAGAPDNELQERVRLGRRIDR